MAVAFAAMPWIYAVPILMLPLMLSAIGRAIITPEKREERQLRKMAGTPHTCGRRVDELGPWEHGNGLDDWVLEGWDPRFKKDDSDPPRFPPDFMDRQPRTCNFCGGLHPEDAIALIEADWEVETTGKFYKRYLNPPGFTAQMEATQAWRMGDPELPKPERPIVCATPPVKLYTMHMDKDQAERFNAALKQARERRTAREEEKPSE
jgi:hypothetical protein